jgi:anti-sigma regulatory factor (Ser/Thr protein kinase)
MDLPDALIVDVADLRITAEPLLTAFSSAWMRIGDWPAVPIMLVVPSDAHRATIGASAIHRYVPVYDSLTTALANVGSPPPRRLATLELVPVLDSSGHARQFVRDACDRWNVSEIAEDAALLATELVENALVHTTSHLRLRVELREDLLTVAVGDDDPREAVLRESAGGSPHIEGLWLVAQLARTWGCAPDLSGGKTVWATLPVGNRRQLG